MDVYSMFEIHNLKRVEKDSCLKLIYQNTYKKAGKFENPKRGKMIAKFLKLRILQHTETILRRL